MKKFILALMFILALQAKAQVSVSTQLSGIKFTHSSWQEIVDSAKAEKRLIFIDFYTQWCGPCYHMATQVFTLPAVAHYYNSNFVCVKMDAEHGEGAVLAKKYGVRSYPTYLFVNPIDEQPVHKSGGRQTPAQFIKTGEWALEPTQRSFYLEEQYAKGNRDKALLINYIRYQQSVYARELAMQAFEELIQNGAKLTDDDVWKVFVEAIKGISPYLLKVSDNYELFCQRFGKEAVDEKLAAETTYGDLDQIESLCNFAGKQFNCEFIRVQHDLRNNKYAAAIKRIDGMLADTTIAKQKLIDRLKFLVRLSYPQADEFPDIWFYKCVEYLRFIAYNNHDRDDANIHHEYAVALEKFLRRTNKSGKRTPGFMLAQPQFGKKDYTMRPDELKQKPRKKK